MSAQPTTPIPTTNTPVPRSSPRLRRQAIKRRKALLRQRVLAHLKRVEDINQKKGTTLRRSLRLHIKECNVGHPPDKPLFKVILFGEDNYFLDAEEKERGPPIGYRLIVDDLPADYDSYVDSQYEESDHFEDSDNPSLGSHPEGSDTSSFEDSDNPSLSSHQEAADFSHLS